MWRRAPSGTGTASALLTVTAVGGDGRSRTEVRTPHEALAGQSHPRRRCLSDLNDPVPPGSIICAVRSETVLVARIGRGTTCASVRFRALAHVVYHHLDPEPNGYGVVNKVALYPSVIVGENPLGLCCTTYAREEPLVPRTFDTMCGSGHPCRYGV